jgi:hypothetical protein
MENLRGAGRQGGGVNRERLWPVLIALLCVLALGMAAATLNRTASTGDPGAGSGDEGPPEGDEGIGLGQGNTSVGSGGGLQIPPILADVLLLLLAVTSTIGLYLVYRDYGVDDVVVGLVLLVLGGLLIWAIWQLLGGPGGLSIQGGAGIGELGVPDSSGGGGGGSNPRSVDPPVAVLAIVGMVLVAGVILVARASHGPDQDAAAPVSSGDDEESTDGTGVAAVGEAAGRAADDIEGEVDTSNAVYRAWREMTDALDVARPETSTPAEFASAAVDAGMAREDVDELTRLFEDVRYGGATPSAERERRAVDALRRIERTYADVDGTDDIEIAEQRDEDATGEEGDASDGDAGGAE